MLEHEPSIVGVSIFPENLAKLIGSLTKEMQVGFMRENTIKSISLQLLNLLSGDTFDEHLSDLSDLSTKDNQGSGLQEIKKFFELSRKKYSLGEKQSKIIEEKLELNSP